MKQTYYEDGWFGQASKGMNHLELAKATREALMLPKWEAYEKLVDLGISRSVVRAVLLTYDYGVENPSPNWLLEASDSQCDLSFGWWSLKYTLRRHPWHLLTRSYWTTLKLMMHHGDD